MSDTREVTPAVGLQALVYGSLPADHLVSRGELARARREGREIIADCGAVGPFRWIGVKADGYPMCVRCAEIATADGEGWES